MKQNKNKASLKTIFLLGMVFLASLALLFSSDSQAATSKNINYQGLLADSSGTAVADGAYTLHLKLYTVASGGAAIWSADQAVTTKNGIFSTLLDVSALDFDGASFYLGVAVSTDPEMTPRKQLGSVPQAINANNLIGDGLIDISGDASILGNVGIGTSADASYLVNSAIGTWKFDTGTATDTNYGTFDTNNQMVLKLYDDSNNELSYIGLWNNELWMKGRNAADVGTEIGLTANSPTDGFFRLTTAVPADGSGAVIGSNIYSDFSLLATATDSYTAFKLNVVDTADPDVTSKLLMDLQTSSVSQFQVTSSGNVGIGVSPSAYLQIKAGTASANTAPLKFTSGINLATAEAGAFEYDGTELYFTPSGTTRETIAYLSDITPTNHNALTINATANGLSVDVNQVLTLGLASTSTIGALSDTDWDTFNNKVSSQWVTTGSDIYYTTGNVGIGLINPGEALDVVGSIDISSGSYYKYNGVNLAMADTANWNYFFGAAGNLTMTGRYNIGSGYLALSADTTGQKNTAYGYNALGSNTIGSDSVAIGYSALGLNTDGVGNVAIGSEALASNTGGSLNVAVGYGSLRANIGGIGNTALGNGSMLKNTSGYENTAVGDTTLIENTIGYNNIAMGDYSMAANTEGYRNSALGNFSLMANTIGYENVALGTGALYSSVSGNFNTALGVDALYYTNNSSNNTAVGFRAGRGVNAQSNSNNSLFGYQSGYGLSTGSNNLLLGYQAGDNITTGSNNIVIGYDIDAASATGDSQLNIGNSIYGNLSTGNVGIGISPTARLHLGGVAGTVSFEINSNETTAASNVIAVRSDVASADDLIFRVQADGAVFADGAYTGTGADYAEYFETTDTDLQSGEAVCLDPEKENAVKRCVRSGDNDITGVISSNPSIIGNGADGREQDEHYKVVAMLGQIKGNVSSENGPIQIGDSLTSSIFPGYLRKADPGESTVGVALQNFSQDKGTVQVLISRKNKSLTVEKVEESVALRIKEMNVEDQVNSIISDARTELDNAMETLSAGIDTKILNLTAIIEAQMEELQADNQANLNLILQNSTDINALTAQVKSILGEEPDSLATRLKNLEILNRLSSRNLANGGLEIIMVDPEAPTIGSANIKTGEKSVLVKTKAVDEKSRIFVTLRKSAQAIPLKIGKVVAGESFVIEANEELLENGAEIDWWIVQED